MALFRQKGRKTWQVRLWVRGANRVRSFSTGTDDAIKARQIELALRSAAKRRAEHKRVVEFVESLTMESIPNAGLPLAEAWDAYCALPETNLTESVKRIKKHHWLTFVEHVKQRHPGVEMLHEVSRDMAFQFVDSLRSGRKGKTINNIRGNVGSVLNALRYRAGLPENPFTVVRQATTTDSVSGRALTEDEVQRLLAAAPEPWHGATLVGLYTGLRFADVAMLKWAQIENSRIVLTPRKTSRHRIRVVIPLHVRLSEYLKQVPRDASGFVFPELAGNYKTLAQHSRYRAILDAAGIKAVEGEYVSFHSLRHTFRTRLARAEVRQEVVMKLGGWRRGEIAEIYNHDTDSLRAAIDRLP